MKICLIIKVFHHTAAAESVRVDETSVSTASIAIKKILIIFTPSLAPSLYRNLNILSWLKQQQRGGRLHVLTEWKREIFHQLIFHMYTENVCQREILERFSFFSLLACRRLSVAYKRDSTQPSFISLPHRWEIFDICTHIQIEISQINFSISWVLPREWGIIFMKLKLIADNWKFKFSHLKIISLLSWSNYARNR